MRTLEKGPGFKNVFKDFFKDVSLASISNAIVGAVFCFTAILFVFGAGPAAGMTMQECTLWMSSTLFFGGIMFVLIAAYYRQPISPGASFAGSVVFITVAGQYGLKAACAGALVSGIILIILGATGLMTKVARFLPAPVVMAMIAGTFLSSGIKIVSPIMTSPVMTIIVLLAFFLCKRFIPKFPAVLGALIAGIIYYLVTGLQLPAANIAFNMPHFFIPDFSNFGKVFTSLTIPLTVLVLGAENAQAYGVLRERGYDAPLSSMTFLSGVGGVISGFSGACNINIAGPMTAITASPEAGKKEGRWTASVIISLLWIIIGPFYGSLGGFFGAMPSDFVGMIAGLALFGVITGSLQSAFRDPKHFGSAGIALVVGAGGVKLLGISAAFWSLVIGVIIYMLFEGGLKEKEPVKPQE